MSNKYLKRTGLILMALVLSRISMAQNIVLAQQTVSQPPAHKPAVEAQKLKDILLQLGRKYQVNIVFEESTVQGITISSANESGNEKLEKRLEALLNPNNLEFKRSGKGTYLIVKKSGKKTAFEQPSETDKTPGEPVQSLPLNAVEDKNSTERQVVVIPVKGRVLDSKGDGLPGVSIVVKGTNKGVTTDISGNYQIFVDDESAILIFSFVGFKSQEVPVGNRSTVDLVLTENVNALEELVVIGYGEQSRKDLVGSVGVLGRKNFGDVGVSNTSQLLQGKIAGVQVINNSGVPGSGAQIVVRGTGSFTSAAPLYVIDGIQSDATIFNSLSPYDIEYISVLKDASSVAIYGAQGANGVVVVTTRLPKNGKTKITYNGYFGISRPWKQFDMLNAEQYTDLVKEWYTNYGQPLPPRLATADANITKTDWQKEMFRTAKITEHHINIGGGTEHVNYSFSVGYTKQESQVQKMDYTRTNFRFNIEEYIGKRIKLGQQLNVRYHVTDGQTSDILGGLRMPPYISVLDPTNKLGGYGIATSALDGNDSQNPLIIPNLYDTKARGLNNYLQLFAEIDIFKDLKFRSQFGGTFNFNQNYSYNPTYAGNQLVTQAQTSEGYAYSLSYILENYFTYNKSFGKHNIGVTAGNSYRDGGLSRSVGLVGSNFANEEIHQIGVAKTVSLSSALANSNARFISYFARVNYNFKEKYILTLTGRRDATSLFSKDNRVGYFPSVGLGWRVSDEKFMENVPIISDLKLRSSWGKTGNSNIAGFSYQSTVWTGSGNSVVYPLGPGETLVNGATIAIPSTPNLKWEETSTMDFGLDATFFKNRLSLSAGYYNRKNKDLLVNVPVALSTGYGGVSGASSSQLINAASAYNRGFELTLGYNGTAKDLKYSINVNGAYNKNQVTSLGTQGAVPIISGAFYSVPPMSRTEVGHPIGAFYGYKYDHVAIDLADIEKYNAIARAKTGDATTEYQAGLLPGDRIFADVNGDGQVTEADQTFLGSPIPKVTFGMDINLNYKNFDFMASLQGTTGVDIINGTKYYLEGIALPFNTKTTVLNRWQNPGDVTDIARAGQNYGTAANNRNSSWFVENGAYARIRNVTLGYTVPGSKIKPLTGNVLSSIRLYVTAQNLFTFTNYSGYDPEVTGSGSFIFGRGIDTGQVPQPRTFMFGIQLGF
ncbi:SusC/RagA family TonB-linked outer membrane protein [Dyadobacter frigoris]|uniref:SusC/RagA family TonB-linked outer membrane protein n=1 Tax=Dyadobacter frigoris TaxID=2576211 RepID=A0A4U6D391_9BACT|nr:SusC/RagA family TonB-linked outer membrane protein [Dyadobacter frigoris]TKT90815.1 SusC/RagA family TonB-linked outer membrane protein [Dyadobacter frigoris]